jgi:hypothetical protein
VILHDSLFDILSAFRIIRTSESDAVSFSLIEMHWFSAFGANGPVMDLRPSASQTELPFTHEAHKALLAALRSSILVICSGVAHGALNLGLILH